MHDESGRRALTSTSIGEAVNTPKIHLRTFAAGSRGYEQSARSLVKSAAKSGLFADEVVWSGDDLLVDGVSERADLDFIGTHSRGFGLWLWKPLLLAQELRNLADGSLLLYLDAGCELNLRSMAAQERFAQYWDLVDKQGMAAFDTGLPAADWTKPAVYAALGMERPNDVVTQVGGGGLFMRVGHAARAAIADWLDLCRFNGGVLLEDDLEEANSFDDYVAHRHDQALLTIVYRNLGLETLPQEFWFGGSVREWRRNGAAYPVWASRSSRGLPMFGTTRSSAFVVYPREFIRRIRS